MPLARSRVSAGLTFNVGPDSCDTSSFESDRDLLSDG
jgi:hypothetical protein